MALGEFELIYRYFSSHGRGDAVALGVGDDAALIDLRPGEQLVTSVDTLVEGRHFLESAFPEDIGFRAVATAASDLAAMGARPLGMTLALTLPEPEDLWLHTFSEGVARAARELSLPLVGGDTTRGPLTVTVQVLGGVVAGTALLRSGAVPGDQLCVSGTLGDAAAGLAVQTGRWSGSEDAADYLETRFLRPQPRLALGMALVDKATACIDVSDGLLADAQHLAAASGVAFEIDSALLPRSPALQSLPDIDQQLRWALTGGDDYELLFTLPAGVSLPAGTSVIGCVRTGQGVTGDFEASETAGFQHF